MDDLPDRIRAWTDVVSAGATPVSADEAQARAVGEGPRRAGPRLGLWRAVAAALVAVLAGAVLVVTLSGDSDEERASGGADEGAEVAFSVLGRSDTSSESLGTLRSAGNADGLVDLWKGANLEGGPPSIDFDNRAVVSITIPDDLCPPTLEGFDRVGDALAPAFREPPGDCGQPLIARTFVVALDWATTGPSFRLTLPADPSDGIGTRTLHVGRPLPSGATTHVWPNETTSADRSSPEATARSFIAHVLGAVDVAATVRPTGQPDEPTAVDVDLGTATTTVLTAPVAEGWIVLQVGGGTLAVSADPPRLLIPAQPGAERVDVLVDTDQGATATVHQAVDVADGIDLPPGTVRSIVTVYRAESGAVLAIEGGSL